MPTTKPRFTLTVDEELLKQIDDYRFDGRFPTRTEAVIKLIELGLQSVKSANDDDSKE